MQPGTRAADVAGEQHQIDQAASVVGTVGVLGDAHAPKNQRRLGTAKDPSDIDDLLLGDAGDLGGERRRVAINRLF